MWKFLPGVSKPESKRKVDTGESNKAYVATKRKRTFQPHWFQMYKWLHLTQGQIKIQNKTNYLNILEKYLPFC